MSLYDENLVDNPFFKEVLNQEDFLNEIIANKWYEIMLLLGQNFQFIVYLCSNCS